MLFNSIPIHALRVSIMAGVDTRSSSPSWAVASELVSWSSSRQSCMLKSSYWRDKDSSIVPGSKITNKFFQHSRKLVGFEECFMFTWKLLGLVNWLSSLVTGGRFLIRSKWSWFVLFRIWSFGSRLPFGGCWWLKFFSFLRSNLSRSYIRWKCATAAGYGAIAGVLIIDSKAISSINSKSLAVLKCKLFNNGK